MNPPTLLRKFISLFWLKKGCFQLAFNKTKHGNREKSSRRRRLKIVHGLLSLMQTCWSLESVGHKSGWYPFENGLAQVAPRHWELLIHIMIERSSILRTSIVNRKGVWWLLEVIHDLNKENVSTSLEEEAELLVSVFLPSERTCLATTP